MKLKKFEAIVLTIHFYQHQKIPAYTLNLRVIVFWLFIKNSTNISAEFPLYIKHPKLSITSNLPI